MVYLKTGIRVSYNNFSKVKSFDDTTSIFLRLQVFSTGLNIMQGVTPFINGMITNHVAAFRDNSLNVHLSRRFYFKFHKDLNAFGVFIHHK